LQWKMSISISHLILQLGINGVAFLVQKKADSFFSTLF